MNTWQLSIWFKPVIVGGFFGVVYAIKRALWYVIPNGRIKDELFKVR